LLLLRFITLFTIVRHLVFLEAVKSNHFLHILFLLKPMKFLGVTKREPNELHVAEIKIDITLCSYTVCKYTVILVRHNIAKVRAEHTYETVSLDLRG
jgi:hypothetical protein